MTKMTLWQKTRVPYCAPSLLKPPSVIPVHGRPPTTIPVRGRMTYTRGQSCSRRARGSQKMVSTVGEHDSCLPRCYFFVSSRQRMLLFVLQTEKVPI